MLHEVEHEKQSPSLSPHSHPTGRVLCSTSCEGGFNLLKQVHTCEQVSSDYSDIAFTRRAMPSISLLTAAATDIFAGGNRTVRLIPRLEGIGTVDRMDVTSLVLSEKGPSLGVIDDGITDLGCLLCKRRQWRVRTQAV